MSHYAEGTTVPIERSKAEIERVLQRYGAQQFMYGWDQERAVVAFVARGRRIEFTLQMPRRDAPEFIYTPARRNRRTPDEALKAWEQACRQRWRALGLVIKAKLEAVEAGIASFEDEFLAYTALPGGYTVAAWLQPQVEEAYRTGRMPALLPEVVNPPLPALAAGDAVEGEIINQERE